MEGLGESECKRFDTLHSLLGGLPVPVQTKDRSMTYRADLEGGFIRELDEEEQKLFTAVEYR